MESPEAHVTRLIQRSDPLLASRCYPSVQREVGEGDFPAVVYQGVGGDTVTTFDRIRQRTCAIRLDFRAKTFAEALRIAGKGLAAVRSGGRLREISGPVDDYDVDLEIYRRMWTVEITV